MDGQTQGKEVKKQKTIAVISCLGKGFQASETTCEDDHEWGNVTELVKTWLKEKRKSVVVDIQRTVEVKQFIISANTSNVCQPDTTQKPISVNSSDDSTDSDPESTSSSSTDSNLLKKRPKRKPRANNKKAGKKKKRKSVTSRQKKGKRGATHP